MTKDSRNEASDDEVGEIGGTGATPPPFPGAASFKSGADDQVDENSGTKSDEDDPTVIEDDSDESGDHDITIEDEDYLPAVDDFEVVEDEGAFEGDEIIFENDDEIGATDEHEIVIEDDLEIIIDDEDGSLIERGGILIEEDDSEYVDDSFDRPTDEHQIVVEDEELESTSRGDTNVTSEHRVVVFEDDEDFQDEDEILVTGDDDDFSDNMIDFQEEPTDRKQIDRSATQEVAPLDQDIFGESEEAESYQDATVEISESELFGSSSVSDAQRAASAARQKRFDEVRARLDSGNNPLVPLHTPAATESPSGSHPSAPAPHRHTSDLSGSHEAAMSSPHAELDKQLRWLLGLLVIALIAALITLAVLLGAFDSGTSNSQTPNAASEAFLDSLDAEETLFDHTISS